MSRQRGASHFELNGLSSQLSGGDWGAWISRSTWLAARAPGEVARSSAVEPELVAMLCEVELLERGIRSGLIRRVARVQARDAAEGLGAALLDLVEPLDEAERTQLALELDAEFRRRPSEMLFRHGPAVYGEACDGVASLDALRLARVALMLEDGVRGRLATAECLLAAGHPLEAERTFGALDASAERSARSVGGQRGPGGDSEGDLKVGLNWAAPGEHSTAAQVARGRAAAAYSAGRFREAARGLHRPPLLGNASASMGALRAATRTSAEGTLGWTVPGELGVEFDGTIDPAERRRIARFLTARPTMRPTMRPTASQARAARSSGGRGQ